MEEPFIITDEQYQRGFVLEEYNGKYSLALAHRYNDKIFKEWCKREFGKGNEKNVPVKVEIGNREEAIANLLLVLGELGYKPPVAGEEDVPF